MTALDETNGKPTAAAAQVPRTPLEGKVVPAWGTPPPAGLTAGDEVTPATGGPVEQHLIAVRREPKARLDRLAGDDPILPVWIRDGQVAKEKLVRGRRIAGRGALLALVNSWQVLRVLVWILRGTAKGVRRVLRWALDIDSDPLSGEIQAKTQSEYDRAVVLRSRRQKFRLNLVGVVLLVLAGLMVWLWLAATWAAWLVIGMVLALTARAGKPEEVKILSPGVRAHRAPVLTCDLVARALSEVVDARTSRLIAENSAALWQSGFVDVPGGHKIRIALPGAAVATILLPHEQRIASALGRPEDCAIIEPLPHITTGHFNLYVFDQPKLGGKPKPGPLARAKRTNWWTPVQVGITRTGECHVERLWGGAWFIGGKPESGKSSLALIAAAHTALDPDALLIIVNLKDGADYLWAKPFAHEYISTTPEKTPTVIQQVTALTQWILDEAARRADFFAKLVEQGKATGTAVTEELSRKYRELRPITVILDEIHRMFDESDNPNHKAYAELLGKVLKAVRFVAITVIGITQLAGGEAIPGVLPRAARVRGCLRVSEAVSFRQIYGDAGQGVFATLGVSRFPQGTVILQSQEGHPLKVGAYYITPHLPEIGRRALALRTAMHTLTGQAAGESIPLDVTDPTELLTHILQAIPTTAPASDAADEDVAWVAELETVLGQREPYADRAEGWLLPELKARRVPTGQLNRRVPDPDGGPGETKQRNQLGVQASRVRAALERLLDD